ncbi:alpha-galactosidase [Streptomyces sp. NPDC003635]
MPLHVADDRRAWFLCTPRTLYAVALSENGLPVQRHWGAALPRIDWETVRRGEQPRWQTDSARPAQLEQEIIPDGGLGWALPGLQVEFPGNVRALELEYDGYEITEGSHQQDLHLRLRDRLFPLTVTLHYAVRDDTDVIRRWLTLDWAETATGDLTVLRADSASWRVEEEDDPWFSTVHGHWGAESRLRRSPVPDGELTLTARTGTTSHHHNPWVMLHAPGVSEDQGQVRGVALAWSGSWHLTVQRRAEGDVAVGAGFGHEGVHLRLAPGDSYEGPASLGLYTVGGFGAASRAWHDYLNAHVKPSPDEVRPVLYNAWEATEFDVREADQIALAERAARLGAELFVLDDGWFGSRVDSSHGLGDWHPNPERFPKGLHPLAGHVRSLGMGFGLWVEPEMVNPHSDLYRAHPDWVLHFPDRVRHEARNQLVLNFARPDVQEWALRWLDDLVGEYRLDFLKWDMNRPFSQVGWPERPADQGWVWYRHTEAVYRVMDVLRSRHPYLRIESCSGGGGRVDAGILQRVDQFWTSDNTDALDRQTIQHGFSQLYPASVMCNWVTDSPNPMSGRAVPLEYRFHVAMAGVLGVGGDLNRWSEAELAEAAGLVAQYKQIRATVQYGRQHRVGGRPGHEPNGVLYVGADEAVLLAYEPRRSLYAGPRRLRLTGLAPDIRYRIEHMSGRGEASEVSGAFLMERGLVVHPDRLTHPTNGTQRFSAEDFVSSCTRLTALPGRQDAGDPAGE